MNNLHIGKLTEETKTTLTESMDQLLRSKAHEARCNPSDLVRDAIYLMLTGASYLDHVVNDRRAALKNQGRTQADMSDQSTRAAVDKTQGQS
jgi:hypothetical protein